MTSDADQQPVLEAQPEHVAKTQLADEAHLPVAGLGPDQVLQAGGDPGADAEEQQHPDENDKERSKTQGSPHLGR